MNENTGPYRQTWRETRLPVFRQMNQDAMIVETMQSQDAHSKKLRADASIEAVINSRYGLALSNYMDLLTGFPEYLK